MAKTTRSDEVARTLLKSSKYRAKRYGLDHTLTLADIVVPDRCPVLGLPLRKTAGRQGPNSPSLDRLNPVLGYVPGNVLVVSWRANEIKKDASAHELARVGSFYTQLLAHHAPRKR